MKTFVEFYFPGISCAGSNQKEVSSRDPKEVTSVPSYAISYRFFDMDNDGTKKNYSAYYFFGKEYSFSEFKLKYHHLLDEFEGLTVSRIVKSASGNFYPLAKDDVVIPI